MYGIKAFLIGQIPSFVTIGHLFSELEMEQNMAIWKAFLPFGKERKLRIQSLSYSKNVASPLHRPVYYWEIIADYSGSLYPVCTLYNRKEKLMHALCIVTTVLLFVNVCRLFLSTLITVKF